jgi:Kef-type K+ transport system membrane component KefB
MDKLGHDDIVLLLVQLSVILAVCRILAETARLIRQPAVLGEILAGVLLGPTILGSLSPEIFAWLFPFNGAPAIVLDGFINLAVVLLLFIAGLEVDLHIVWQQGRQAIVVSAFSLIVPFSFGFIVSFLFPGFFGVVESDALVFSLFIGTVMGMTALPVIVRILMDLNIFRSSTGMLIVASAMIVDLLCWFIFTLVLSMMDNQQKSNITQTIWLTVGFSVLMLTLGKWLINRVLPWINKKMAWPGGVLSLSLSLGLLAAAFTEYIGIHAIFGAFIIGVALGDSEHLSERAKEIVHQFINNIFAPIFFVSIGLFVNFISSFDLALVLVVFAVAFVSKSIGATVGARLGGSNVIQSLAVGMGMNTHGTLEIILGTLALRIGLISDEVFVAILCTVIATIIISAPLIKYCVELDKKRSRLKDLFTKIMPDK